MSVQDRKINRTFSDLDGRSDYMLEETFETNLPSKRNYGSIVQTQKMPALQFSKLNERKTASPKQERKTAPAQTARFSTQVSHMSQPKSTKKGGFFFTNQSAQSDHSELFNEILSRGKSELDQTQQSLTLIVTRQNKSTIIAQGYGDLNLI